MASLSAKMVARKALETIGKGHKPNISQIAIEQGYSRATAYSGEVQKTASYQAEIATALDKMVALRDKVLRAMLAKDIDRERFDTLARSTATLTHDIQLLSGKSTDNVAVKDDRNILLEIVNQLRLDNTLDKESKESSSDTPLET